MLYCYQHDTEHNADPYYFHLFAGPRLNPMYAHMQQGGMQQQQQFMNPGMPQMNLQEVARAMTQQVSIQYIQY